MPIASNATPHDEQSWGVGLDGSHEMNRAIVLEEDGQSRLAVIHPMQYFVTLVK